LTKVNEVEDSPSNVIPSFGDHVDHQIEPQRVSVVQAKGVLLSVIDWLGIVEQSLYVGYHTGIRFIVRSVSCVVRRKVLTRERQVENVDVRVEAFRREICRLTAKDCDARKVTPERFTR